MEKSMSEPVEPGQKVNFPLMFTISAGLSLYLVCFFTMLMRNSFMDGDIEILWYHLFLRVMFLAGACVVLVLAARFSDWVLGERGNRALKLGACAFSVVAAISSFMSYSFELTMPLAFDVFAWSLAGAGLVCLLLLWVELLASLDDALRSASLTLSAVCGAVGYLLVNLLPYPFNIASLCLCPLVSLSICLGVERDEGTVPAAFVPLEESRERAVYTPSFKGLSVAYGVVFGLGIGSITQVKGGTELFVGIAVVLVVGALAARTCLRRYPDRIQQSSGFKLLFPVLIVALIPMSFLQGWEYVACNLLLLGSYIMFDTIGIDLVFCLAEKKKASFINLAALSQTCLFAGMLLGHVIGLAATSSGVMDYKMLSFAALALVAVLAIFVTFAPVSPLVAAEEEDGRHRSEEFEPKRAQGWWKERCMAVARSAGLSARETEVFMLLAKGRGIEHIQNKLSISVHTVKTHVYNIYRKMGISSREELLDAIEEFDMGSNAASDEETAGR